MALIGKPKIKESRWKVVEKKTQKDGLLHTLYSPNGDLYTREWRKNLRHGQGTQVWTSARTMYEGEWKWDVRDGFGTLYKLQLPSERYLKVYLGNWRNDKKEGFGKYFYSSSSRYEGEWVRNERSGNGRMTYENGDVYEGEWFRDKPHGKGVLLLKNGNRYEGYMKDGKKQGHGRFVYKDMGQVYEGFWVDDVPKCGKLCEYNRKNIHTPELNPIPPGRLQDVHEVLREALGHFCSMI